MKRRWLVAALVCAALLYGSVFLACNDDDDNGADHAPAPDDDDDDNTSPDIATDDDDDNDNNNDNNNDNDDDDASPEPPTHPLLDLTPGNIQLPFPNEYLTAADAGSTTGRRLDLEKELPAPVAAALAVAEATDLREAAGELDGFSPLAAVLVPFSGPLALPAWSDQSRGAEPEDGGGIARLFDITASPAMALGYRYSFIEGQNVLVLEPASPLPAGRRILVCLVGPLLDAAGDPVERPALFDAAMTGGDLPDDPLAADLRDIRDLLDSGALGLDSSQVLLAFSYWTGAGCEALDRMRRRLDELDAQEPLLPEDVTIQDAQTISGFFNAAEFRVGEMIPAAADPPIQSRVRLPFLLRLPPDAVGPLPPVIYLHGLGGSRFSSPTMEGAAVFSADAVLHGDRPKAPLEPPFPFINFEELRLLRDNVRQTVADHFTLARMIRHLAADPAAYGLPAGLFQTDTLAVVGHSLGCINGSAFTAADPLVDHLACVAGGGMFSLFQKLSVYGLFMPAGVRGLPPHEALIFRHLMQAVVDPGDPAALAPGLAAEPPDGRGPRNVLLIEGVGDRSVPNWSTEALAWSAGLGVAADSPSNWFALASWPLPVAGNLEANGETASGLLCEYQFAVSPPDIHGTVLGSPLQLEQVRIFLQTAAATGIAQIVAPEVKP